MGSPEPPQGHGSAVTEMARHALAGALFATSAVIAASISWTLTQKYTDRRTTCRCGRNSQARVAVRRPLRGGDAGVAITLVMSGFRLISMMLPDTFFSRRQSTCRPTPIMRTRAVSSMGAGMPSVMLRSKTG